MVTIAGAVGQRCPMTSARPPGKQDPGVATAGGGNPSGGPIGEWSVGAVAVQASIGDERAWEELVRRFDGMIGATGRRHRLLPADVAELRQTVWLRLLEHLGRVEQPQRVGGWLATTAHRESLHILAGASRCAPGGTEVFDERSDAASPGVDAHFLAEEDADILRLAFARLRPHCRRLLGLLVSEDPLPYKELAALLEMPVGSIGPTRGRCLEHLRKLVAEEGMALR